MDARVRLGRLGESLAAEFLQRRGATVVARNVAVGRGEIDLVVRFAGVLTAVEVRTVRRADPTAERFPTEKRNRVHRLAREIGCRRVDLVAVQVTGSEAVVRWFPNVR